MGQVNALTARIAHLGAILRIPDDAQQDERLLDDPLDRHRLVLWEERRRVSERLMHLDRSIAHLVARWGVEQAITVAAGTIVVEDLRDLEPRGLCARNNARTTPAQKGLIATYLEQKVKAAGIAIITVKAPGTSACCSRCGGRSRHTAAPDRLDGSHRWLRCSGCGTSLARDHAAAERIAAHGLALISLQRRLEPRPALVKSPVGPATPVVSEVTSLAPTPRHKDTAPRPGHRARLRREHLEREQAARRARSL